MNFLYPLVLLLLIPLLILCVWFIRTNYLALKTLEKLVHPSKIQKLTYLLRVKNQSEYSYIKFWIYFVFFILSFSSLLISLAGPYSPGDSEIQTKQTSVFFLFDGSWSMEATDVGEKPGYEYIPRSRFEEARYHSMSLMTQISDVSFGVITFAGSASQHSHPLPDKKWIRDIIFNEINNYNSFHSGTNYISAFQELVDSSKYLQEGFQVILYSDGDASEEEKSGALEYLKIFSRLHVPIHVVALGKPEGAETELVFNLLESVDTDKNLGGDASGKEYQATTTVSVQKRQSIPDYEFLKSIAENTGGVFIQTHSDNPGYEQLSQAIEEAKDKEQVLLWEAGGKKSLTPIFLILPFLFFLFDFLYIRKAVKIGA